MMHGSSKEDPKNDNSGVAKWAFKKIFTMIIKTFCAAFNFS